jgi:hypothetical protein
VTPALPVYRCTSCRAVWSYAAVRHVARCKHCGAGLVRAAPDAAGAPPPRPAARARPVRAP